MLLAFVLLIILLMHIQFFVRNILFGTDEAVFFTFTIRYLFEREVALTSLYFACGCAIAFAVGYRIMQPQFNPKLSSFYAARPTAQYALPLWPLVVTGLLQIVPSLNLLFESGFIYQVIAQKQLESGFIFEMRMIFLLLLSHLMLNINLSELMSLKRYRTARMIVYLYIISTLLLQTRSRIFEVGTVLAFAHLMWNGDSLRFKYFAVLGVGLILPNIIVLGRLGWPDDLKTAFDGIFSFEYTVLFNNVLSAAIVSGSNSGGSFTFTPSMGLLLPSPLRALFGIEVVKSDYYTDLSEVANVGGGGFALLAELYSNFGWFTLLVLLAIGLLIGHMNGRAARVGQANMVASAAPLLYGAFILALRNDLGVFIKYSLQLFVVTLIMHYLLKLATSRKRRQEI